MKKQLINIIFVIFIAITIVSCQPSAPASIADSSSEIKDIRVQMVEPERTTSKVEQFPLPNCGGNEKLVQSLGTYASISQSATVGTKATIAGGAEVEIPETAKLKLEIQVEQAYQRSFESANSRTDSIEMSASPSTHIVYTILWEEQTFESIVQYSMDSEVYAVPYTYKLNVPKIDTSYSVVCQSKNDIEEASSEQLVVQSPSSGLLFSEDFENGKAQDISYVSGDWVVVTDESGNMVYEMDNTNGSKFPGFDFGSTTWENYTIEYRVKMLETHGETPWVILEFRRSNDAEYKYVLSLTPLDLWLNYTTQGVNWQQITGHDYNFEKEIWHSVKVEVENTEIKVHVDNSLLINTTDSKISSGALNMQVGPGTYAQFDDITVTKIGQ